jgi:hypothetical protein
VVKSSARAIGILLLLLSICGMIAARCQSLEPDDVVRILYNTSDTYVPPFAHWSRKMRRLWAEELQWMDANTPFGPVLDGDYIRNTQDGAVQHLSVTVVDKTEDIARVKATFDSADGRNVMLFDMVREDGEWGVDEVRSVEGSNKGTLTRNLNVCQKKAC